MCLLLTEKNVGPIRHAYTSHDNPAIALESLKNFEKEVNNIQANGGGDYPEYAYSAMLAALNYSFTDEYGCEFVPMHQNSELIVITDATSKQEDLNQTVIDRANEQGVSIHFILSDVPASYYQNVATETGGIIYDDHYTTWNLVNAHFYEEVGESKRKKRYAPASPSIQLLVNVSIFTYSLKVSIFTPTLLSGVVSITLPNTTTENAEIKDYVMLYLKPNPIPGHYYFHVGADIHNYLVDQDVSLDVRLLYMDRNQTTYSSIPSSACKLAAQYMASQ